MEDYNTSMLIGMALGLLVTGASAGILAGLLGVGGGIIIVPVLVIVTDLLGLDQSLAMLMVVGTSLATIIPTSISSARSHWKRGGIDSEILRRWTPAIFLGALVGGLAASVIGATGLSLVFGGVALLVAINFVMPKTVILADAPPKSVLTQSAVAFPIGFVSSLMGVGGGTLSVPAMSMMSVPVHKAVATASVFGLAIAVPAAAGFVWSGLGVEGRPPGSVGYVNLPAAILIVATSVLTAPIGARLAHRLNPRRLKLAFALFLAVSAVRMLSKGLA